MKYVLLTIIIISTFTMTGCAGFAKIIEQGKICDREGYTTSPPGFNGSNPERSRCLRHLMTDIQYYEKVRAAKIKKVNLENKDYIAVMKTMGFPEWDMKKYLFNGEINPSIRVGIPFRINFNTNYRVKQILDGGNSVIMNFSRVIPHWETRIIFNSPTDSCFIGSFIHSCTPSHGVYLYKGKRTLTQLNGAVININVFESVDTKSINKRDFWGAYFK
jgi:hypothetical protein